jgi:hypothetical protein
MDKQKNSEDFLKAATAGLKNDPELQLDVQAELRSHLEEHQREAEGKGLAPDVAADEAIRAMGRPAELAASLESANRHRMKLRSLIKIFAQWVLAPLSLVIAIMTTDLGSFQIFSTLNALCGTGYSIGIDKISVYRNLTPEQRLVLYGDPTRRTTCEKQKAIWEKWPKSKVYLHNYVTHLISGDGIKPERYPELAAEIAKLQPLDPDNARFDYILAGGLLDQAVESKSRSEKGPDGKPKTVYDTTIKDRAKLDEAMAHLKTGLAKPEFRRYSREMSAERLAIMGEPTSLLQELGEIAMLSGILLPDLSHLRNLERTSLFYGELLANEGKRKEADIFFNAYRSLLPQINGDAFTLIDVLVVGAIAGIAEERLPEIYVKLGDSAAAENARVETAALAAPIKQWKEKKKKTDKTPEGQAFERNLKRHGGILAGMLLPAVGEYPTPVELAPSRNLEYVAAEGLVLIVFSLGLLVVMLFYAIMAIYYRWMRGGGAVSLLLLPSGWEILRILGFCVLMPILLYYVITRWLPWTERDLSLSYGGLQFIMQYMTVSSAIIMGTTMLSDNFVRRRCRELLLPVAPYTRNFYIIGWATVGVFLVLSLLPQSWLDSDHSHIKILCVIAVVVLFLLIMATLIYSVICDIRYGRKCAAYYGSLARTLIPVTAMALIIINVSSRPYLRMAERQLLAKDTILRVDSTGGGFTAVESRVTQRLKAEIQKAVEALPPVPEQ